jgi:neprilysin
MPREERREAEKLYNERTIAQLQTDYPYNNWLSYFNGILPAESQLTTTDTVVVGALSFFEKLGDLVAKTPKRVVANYLVWRQVSGSVGYLPEIFKQRQFQYNKATSGLENPDPRWLECINVALNYYPHAFGSLYVRKHFREDAKAKALDMVNNIKDEFKIMLKEITWMDEETKKGANEKADTISAQIGFADELIDDAKLTEFYNTFPVTIDATQYYSSAFAMNIASTNRNNKRFREAIDWTDWTLFVTPAIVNAFYSSLENSIKFPAGILQGAFFNADRPQYMNYGGIGFVIGHEITHGEFN